MKSSIDNRLNKPVEWLAENLALGFDWDSQSDFPAIQSLSSTLSDYLSYSLPHTGQHVAEFVSLSEKLIAEIIENELGK